MAESHLALAPTRSQWGNEFEGSFIQSNQGKSSSSDSFSDLMPQKLSSTEGFNPTKSGSSLEFRTQTMYIEQVQARALEPEPIYFEKYSSFSSNSSAQTLLGEISAVFTARSNVDHEPSFDKNKIKGVAYENNGRCTFKVRLYQGSVPGTLLCEFQRRSGCVVSFNKFYRRTIADITSHVNKVAGEKTGNWLKNIEQADLAMNAMNAESVQLDDATAMNLISMAGCDNVDVQREGAQALANVAKSPLNQVKLAETQMRVVELLQKLLGSVDTELCRSGSVLLCCMSAQESLRSSIALSCLEKMVAILDAPPSFESTDSKRQVAQALAILSASVAAEIVVLPAGQRCVQVLKKNMRSYDASFQNSVLLSISNLHNSSQ